MFIKEIKIVKFNKINNILEISVKSLSLKKVILHNKNKSLISINNKLNNNNKYLQNMIDL